MNAQNVVLPKFFHLDDFTFCKTIGTGTFGRVRLVLYPNSNKHFVMKIMKKSEIVRYNQIEHVFSERNILASVRHPFIVKLYCTFQDPNFLYMLLEYVPGGELFTYLRKYNRFSIRAAKFYISELILALEYLHSLGIIYRDLKPENLLLDQAGHIKITDFGFAKVIGDQRTWTLCGTPEYIAPEIIENKGHGASVDWWALGILLYEMLVGSPPFYDTSSFKIYEKILSGTFAVPTFLDDVTGDLIKSLLSKDPSKRLGNLKGGAEDIKNHPWFTDIDWKLVHDKKMSPPIVPVISSQGDASNYEVYPEENQFDSTNLSKESNLQGFFYGF